MTHMSGRARTTLCLVLACAALAACSSSFGSGGGVAPAPTYVVLPNGDTVPARPAY